MNANPNLYDSIGRIDWCTQDLINELENAGIHEPDEEAVAFLREWMDAPYGSFQERLVDRAFRIIADYIEDHRDCLPCKQTCPACGREFVEAPDDWTLTCPDCGEVFQFEV